MLQLIKCGFASEQPCLTARCGYYPARLSCSIFCASQGEHDCKTQAYIEYHCDGDGDTDNVNLNNYCTLHIDTPLLFMLDRYVAMHTQIPFGVCSGGLFSCL